MTTIFTDDFAHTGVEITIDPQSLGYKGRQLIFTTDDNREFRLQLNDDQLTDLCDRLVENGYMPKTWEGE